MARENRRLFVLLSPSAVTKVLLSGAAREAG
jgi:hypothetical protein